MKQVNAGLATYLDANSVLDPIWHMVTLTPRSTVSGAVTRLTDAPFDVPIARPARPGDPEGAGSVTFLARTSAVPLILVSGRKEMAGIDIATTSVTLLCGEGAVWNGKRPQRAAVDRDFDGAWVKIERAYGGNPGLGLMHVFEGRVAGVKPTSSQVVLEVETGLTDLSVEIPRRVYQPGCPYTLGDARCGVSLLGYTYGTTVGVGVTVNTVPVPLANPDGYFEAGSILFNDGPLAKLRRGIVAWAGGVATLDIDLPTEPRVGDSVTLVAGCLKTPTVCDGKFANLVHFGAFPYMPKNEQAQ